MGRYLTPEKDVDIYRIVELALDKEPPVYDDTFECFNLSVANLRGMGIWFIFVGLLLIAFGTVIGIGTRKRFLLPLF